MTSESITEDAALFEALRRTWTALDPVPRGLVDAMVAAVAAADLGSEYALLTLVESDAVGAVRGDADMLTMQFSDGHTNVLVHVTREGRETCRLDGWVDGDVDDVRLLQEGAAEVRATPAGGRFAFDTLTPGVTRLRLTLRTPAEPGGARELLTPGSNSDPTHAAPRAALPEEHT